MAYVYRHIRTDKNEPFYIGIGSDANYNRAHQNSKNKRSDLWHRVSSKGYEVEILMDDLTWEQACEKEKEFISMYGRINKGTGTLSNLTDGGDGSLGAVISPENLLRLKEKMTGSGNHMFGVKHSAEIIEQIRQKKIGQTAWNKGVPMLESQKNILSKVKKGCKTWNKGIPRTDEEKIKISLSHLAKNKTPWNKGKKGVNGYGKAKTVLNLENGVFYQSAKEAAFAHNKNYSTLKDKLNCKNKNNIQFIYI